MVGVLTEDGTRAIMEVATGEPLDDALASKGHRWKADHLSSGNKSKRVSGKFIRFSIMTSEI